MEKTVYLASPYSHPEAEVRADRYEKVSKLAADIIADSSGEIMPFAPITHSHPLFVLRPECGADFKQWQEFDEWMIDNCDEVWVFCLPGWRESVGVQSEIHYALRNRKPIVYIRADGAVANGMSSIVDID